MMMKKKLLMLTAAMLLGATLPAMAQQRKGTVRKTTTVRKGTPSSVGAPVKKRKHMEFLGLQMGGKPEPFLGALHRKGFTKGSGSSEDNDLVFLKGRVNGVMQEISIYTEGDRVDLICLGQEVGSEKAAINLFNRYKSEATALYGGKWRSEDKGHAELKLPYGSVECSYGMYDSGIYSVEMRIYDKGNDWKEILTISKFVVPVNSKELYIRRKPDNNSPYFVFVEDEENGPGLMGPEGEHCWDKNTFKRSLVKPFGVPVLGVVGEIGDWYKVYLSSWFHWDYVSEVGYVQKSACKDAKLLPLTNKDITSGVRTFGHVRTSGKYKGMVLTWGCSSLLRPCVGESFQYGKVLNSNVLLLNKLMDYWISDDKKLRLNGCFVGILTENKYVVKDEDYGVRGKLEILPDIEIQSVTEKPYYDPTPYEAYFHLEGESTLYGMCLEPSKELKVFVDIKTLVK